MQLAYKLLTIYTLIFLALIGSSALLGYPPLNATYLLLGLIPYAVYFFLKLNQYNLLGKASKRAANRAQVSWILLLADPTRWWVQRNWLSKLSLLTLTALTFGIIGATTYAVFDYRQTTSLNDLKTTLDQTNRSLAELKSQTDQIEHLQTTAQTMSDQLLALEESLGITAYNQDGSVATPVLGTSDTSEATAALDAINQQIDQTLLEIDFDITPTPTPPSSPSSNYIQGTITLTNPQSGKISVYAQPDPKSDIISHLEGYNQYAFTSKQQGWYQVSLQGGKTGWVTGNLVKEQ